MRLDHISILDDARGTKRLPFAGYSIGSVQLPVASFQLSGWRPSAASLLETGTRKLANQFFDIAWDDSRTGASIRRP